MSEYQCPNCGGYTVESTPLIFDKNDSNYESLDQGPREDLPVFHCQDCGTKFAILKKDRERREIEQKEAREK